MLGLSQHRGGQCVGTAPTHQRHLRRSDGVSPSYIRARARRVAVSGGSAPRTPRQRLGCAGPSAAARPRVLRSATLRARGRLPREPQLPARHQRPHTHRPPPRCGAPVDLFAAGGWEVGQGRGCKAGQDPGARPGGAADAGLCGGVRPTGGWPSPPRPSARRTRRVRLLTHRPGASWLLPHVNA